MIDVIMLQSGELHEETGLCDTLHCQGLGAFLPPMDNDMTSIMTCHMGPKATSS